MVNYPTTHSRETTKSRFEQICCFAKAGEIAKWEEVTKLMFIPGVKWKKSMRFNHFKPAPKVDKLHSCFSGSSCCCSSDRLICLSVSNISRDAIREPNPHNP
jgi:hypothetical protein